MIVASFIRLTAISFADFDPSVLTEKYFRLLLGLEPGVHVVVVASGRVVAGGFQVHREVGFGRRRRTRKRVDNPDERGREDSGLAFGLAPATTGYG